MHGTVTKHLICWRITHRLHTSSLIIFRTTNKQCHYEVRLLRRENALYMSVCGIIRRRHAGTYRICAEKTIIDSGHPNNWVTLPLRYGEFSGRPYISLSGQLQQSSPLERAISFDRTQSDLSRCQGHLLLYIPIHTSPVVCASC